MTAGGTPSHTAGALAGLRPPRALWFVVGAVAAAVPVTLSVVATVDGDGGNDVATVLRSTFDTLVTIRWQYAMIVFALAAVHYLASALATRAAAGLRLPLGQAILVQLAAAAANRLSPAGLGAAALNARYLYRSGLSVQTALGAVTALTVFGGVADLLVLVTLVTASLWWGLPGGRQELELLRRRVIGPVTSFHPGWLWAGLVAAGLLLATVFVVRRRRGPDHVGHSWRQFVAPAVELVRQPWRLATLMTASAATTLVLGFAFVCSIAMIPGQRPQATVPALLIIYLLGGVASAALPLPAGLGATEGALIGGLVAAQVPAGEAVAQVVGFRLITFWLPAVIGVATTQQLARAGAL